MKVAIVGYSVEGKSAAAYWHKLGHDITVLDAKSDLELPGQYHHQFGSDYLAGLDQYDLIVRSPGVHPRVLFEASPGLDKAKVTSNTNEFLAQCPARVIGVTGTKGKGTTSSLVATILRQAGHTVHLGGNIGIPALDFLNDVEADDWVVLEMSSFQLMDLTKSPHVAVMLMIAPDHQDWHPDMHEYLEAKQTIFKFQHEGDRAIYNACNLYSMQSGLRAPAEQVAYNDDSMFWVDGVSLKMRDQVIGNVDQIKLYGRHNWDNVCAAIAVTWPIVKDAEQIMKAVSSFKGLEHRLEPVATLNEVLYINDSYSSNPQPTVAALQAIEGPKVMIIGGYDRHHDYSGMAKAIAGADVRQVIVIGAVSHQIVKALEAQNFHDYSLGAADMTQIVELAARVAQPGDTVILSPGAPSFDMFTNFKQRGEHFKEAVHNLVKPA